MAEPRVQGSARRVALPGNESGSGSGSGPQRQTGGGESETNEGNSGHAAQESSTSALGLLHEYWHFGFFVYGVFSVVRRRDTSRGVKAAQVAGLAVLLGFAFKLERVLSRKVLEPLFAKLFGDNDELRRKIEAEEAELREMLRKHREKKAALTNE
ncbi:Hypothetical Protein FCC1311_038132 [Hondaea fermentalgiana]|uniref:Uncharacterized protein n=1 Tax=Hondaea fermentalgiana TaxID=2315210 RepID=A0A2R5G997_9STRA|nr:Hypothetical Protein FCC1311_038132 [Hondaea fermentalgiana]|eukprot:GBG27590.1 Hypothetical Protein FCC1311_038132 [Hondaea fermentalgiana]